MEYENKTDFEINKAIAEKLGYLVKEIDDNSALGMTASFHNEYPNTVWVARTEDGYQSEPWWQFCPTHDWSDGGPIIAKNMINLHNTLSGREWRASIEVDDGEAQYEVASCVDENPLRAAMITYLNCDDKYLKA